MYKFGEDIEIGSRPLRIIKERLKWDIRVCAADVSLTELGGVITVSGVVDRRFRKLAIMEIVKNTEGVLGIFDQLRVGDAPQTDEDLTRDIQGRIRAIVSSPKERVEVEVQDGVVRLSGVVLTARAKAWAGKTVWEKSGVKDCLNEILIEREGGRYAVI